MSTQPSAGHRLLLDFVDLPELLENVAPDADLTAAGLNSGDLIRLALAIEERTGGPLDDDELTALHTLDGIDQVLASRAGTQAAASAGEAR